LKRNLSEKIANSLRNDVGRGGDLAQKRNKERSILLRLQPLSQCEYALWDRPINKTSPTCQASFLVEKVSKQAGRSVQCRNEDCGYKEAS
jgi:DNA topoisomerase-1